ncbi:hypothetical protein SO802_007207 [Lithocarpus litseifolius]|uniref:HMA domain-containing protein n=1 Tax=Lithocarpus litseifolius TaxID=425828 RepID=A0AAW2DRI5_9ROSI
MAEEKKTTFMRIKVDLQCHRCRKKIKKVLCKFPQIQDQEYNEKENYVVIKVVCCSPEKVKQKIICKGGDTIKCIEIRETEKKPPEKEKKPPEKEKPPDQKEKKEKKDPEPVSVPVRPGRFGTCCTECYAGRGGGPCLYGHGTTPVPVYSVGVRTCCTECYEGRDGGPCHYGHGRPPPCYDGYYYGRPIYDSYGGGWYRRSCYTYVSRCEESSSGCTIM